MIDVAYRYIVFRCIAVCLVCFPGVFVEEMILGEFQSVGNDYGFVKNDGRFLERPEEQQKQQSSEGLLCLLDAGHDGRACHAGTRGWTGAPCQKRRRRRGADGLPVMLLLVVR
jgi:hypothetical protein